MNDLTIDILKFYANYFKKPFRSHFYPLSAFLWSYRIVRTSLSVVFLVSGISKLLNPSSFSIIIESYGLLPDVLILPVAILLPLAEVLAGIGLLFDIRGSLASISIMLTFFITILIYGIWLGLDVDCGCFGPNDPESKAFHSLSTALIRDVWMLAGALFLYIYRSIQSVKPVGLTDICHTFNKRRYVR